MTFLRIIILMKNSSNFRKNSPFESILEKNPPSNLFRKNSPFEPILERTPPSILLYKTKIFCLGLSVEILDMTNLVADNNCI